jgi:hypothetical protein
MTERERLAADVARLEWLADARFGPAAVSPPSASAETSRAPLGAWRRGLTAVVLLSQRVRLRPDPAKRLSRPAAAPTR